MRLLFTKSFRKDYMALPAHVQELAGKKLNFLAEDLRHPSLRVKKMEGSQYLWEGSITKQYRFTFQVQEDSYIIRRVGTHDILRTP